MPATVTYYDLGQDKQLNEIIFTGSHDAAITQGSANTQTQDLDIIGQANAGVRLFDLRIAAAAAGSVNGVKAVELKAFHADPSLVKNETKQRTVLGRTETVQRAKLKAGGFGMTLTTILNQAKQFIQENPNEFLLLKFDKCYNWSLIAEACVSVLAETIYAAAGNLNVKTLQQLRGRVIVLFSLEGLAAARAVQSWGIRDGILAWTNIKKDGGAYAAQFDGLQYYGSGGTSAKPWGDKIAENKTKQKKLMSEGAGLDPDLIGMMYWTTTSMSGSIRERTNQQWTAPNVASLQSMWINGLGESILSRAPAITNPFEYSSAGFLRAFMPNFVMIDFADVDKCAAIFQLNRVAATALTSAIRNLKPKSTNPFD